MAFSALALPSSLPVLSNSKSKALICWSPLTKKFVLNTGIGFLTVTVIALSYPQEADATRIQSYATVVEPLCEMSYALSGLGFCDISAGDGEEAPRFELVNIHYTARFADGTVFDSSYKRARPLTTCLGAGKVIKGLDQGILGCGGVPPMQVGGKRKQNRRTVRSLLDAFQATGTSLQMPHYSKTSNSLASTRGMQSNAGLTLS